MKKSLPSSDSAVRPFRWKMARFGFTILSGLFLQGITTPLHGQLWIGPEGDGGNGAWNAANFGLASGPTGGSSGSNLVFNRTPGSGLPDQIPNAVVTLSGTGNSAKTIMISNGKKVELKMTTGSALSVRTGAIGMGAGVGNSLTITGPESGEATVTTTRITLHGGADNYGTQNRTLVTLSGPGLTFRSTLADIDTSSNRGRFLVTGGAVYDKSAGGFHIYGGKAQFDNQLVIDHGTMMAQAITVRGLMQVGSQGVIQGVLDEGDQSLVTPLAITVEKESGLAYGGRFEAEGIGVGSSVAMEIKAGGVFAVGLSDVDTAAPSTAAATLDLDGKVTFQTGSVLELDLFGRDAFDQIRIGVNGELTNLGTGALLTLNLHDYTPQSGDSFQLFVTDGLHPDAITGAFNLSLLDPEVWDLSNFNSAGSWTIVAIPEPQSMVLLLGLAGGWLVVWRCRKRKVAVGRPRGK